MVSWRRYGICTAPSELPVPAASAAKHLVVGQAQRRRVSITTEEAGVKTRVVLLERRAEDVALQESDAFDDGG
jgi:hypothetical protein